jgi:hypothetical protein
MREKYCWLVTGGWFVLREKYYWLVAGKPNEQGRFLHLGGIRPYWKTQINPPSLPTWR